MSLWVFFFYKTTSEHRKKKKLHKWLRLHKHLLECSAPSPVDLSHYTLYHNSDACCNCVVIVVFMSDGYILFIFRLKYWTSFSFLHCFKVFYIFIRIYNYLGLNPIYVTEETHQFLCFFLNFWVSFKCVLPDFFSLFLGFKVKLNMHHKCRHSLTYYQLVNIKGEKSLTWKEINYTWFL